MIATTGGYIGDAPPYQGHVVVIGAKHGRLLHVWNSLCSGHHGLIYPPRCTPSDSAIWGRAGAVVVPGSGKLLVATGNGPWNGHTNWGDAVLVLSAKAKLVGNYTPTNTAQLNVQDIDLGSTSPVYLTSKLIAQGGKDGKIRLLSLRRLRGTRPHKGHELQIVSTPSGTDLFTAPAVWRSGKQVWLIAADGGGTQAWSLQRRAPPLGLAERHTAARARSSPAGCSGSTTRAAGCASTSRRAGSSSRRSARAAATGTARSSRTAASLCPRATRTTTPRAACSTSGA